MHNHVINDIYDQISKILKNDQKYPFETMGALIVKYVSTVDNNEFYYTNYPQLLDIVELSGSLEHGNGEYQREVIDQMRYKMQQLRKILPEIR